MLGLPVVAKDVPYQPLLTKPIFSLLVITNAEKNSFFKTRILMIIIIWHIFLQSRGCITR